MICCNKIEKIGDTIKNKWTPDGPGRGKSYLENIASNNRLNFDKVLPRNDEILLSEGLS